jgi:60S ribosome subunit biogenesis protein NIP7
MKMAISIAREKLISLGVCLGKFSKTGKFRLHITSLDVLSQYAKFKVRANPFSRNRGTM